MACLFVVYVLFFKDLEHANFYLFFCWLYYCHLKKICYQNLDLKWT